MATDTQSSMQDEDPAWHEIEHTMAEIASISKSDVPFGQVASELLERTVRLLSAAGGAVWLVDADGGLQLQCEINLQSLERFADSPQDNAHVRLLEQVFRAGEPVLIPPRSAGSDPGAWRNPTDFLLLIHPVGIDQEIVGLIEVIQRPTANAATVRGSQRLVSVVCECAADRLQRDRLRKLGQLQARSRQFERFAQRIHESLDLRRTAYELVNEGRNYLGCDRLSVAVLHWRTYRLLAISGVDTVNRRSNVVRHLERLASAVAVHGESLWYGGGASELPQQIEERLDAYVDIAHVRTLAVVPMQTTTETNGLPAVGILIAETFDGAADDELQVRMASVANQGAFALQNALDYRNLPTLPFARRQSGETGRLRSKAFLGTVLGLFAVLAIMAVLMRMPAEFKVGVRGELQPQQRRDVFAPLDGQIVDLRVAHHDAVEVGDVLLVVDSTDIDLELQRVTGQRDTTRTRLLAVESVLLQFNPADPRMQVNGERLAAEQQELKQLLASQDQQLVLLSQQREKLTVRSPIEGRVLTWDVSRLLEDRPVQRGQTLLTVANLTGSWTAELQVPDDRIGFVTAAQAARETPVRVTFELATQRGVVHAGVIQHIANRVEVTEDERPCVRVTVDVGREDISRLRPGATILAQIHCGQKPLGYIWLHDLIDTIREWLQL